MSIIHYSSLLFVAASDKEKFSGSSGAISSSARMRTIRIATFSCSVAGIVVRSVLPKLAQRGGSTCRQLRKVLLELRDQRLMQAYQQGRSSIADDLVFPGNREGEPLRARLVQETCTRVLADARMRKFRFHDLRHTFGSLLIEEGAPLPYVRDQMGHSSIQMTADKYVHLIARRNVRFIDRLDTATSPQQSATQAQPIKKYPVQNGSGPHPQVIDRKGWCERGDSNPHPLRDQILSLARLPIPPLSLFDFCHQFNNLD